MGSSELSRVHTLQIKRTEAYGDNNMDPDAIKSEITDIMNNLGYSRIGSGDYRIVYSNNNEVVKIAWNNQGVKENRDEYNNWCRVKNTTVDRIDGCGTCEAKEYLAEVRDYDENSFGWIKMEKVSTGMDNVTVEEAEDLRNTFSNSGIDIDEIEPYNIGRKHRPRLDKNVPVVFDYAGT